MNEAANKLNYGTDTAQCEAEKAQLDIEVVDYDQLLSSAGELGRYQIFLFFLTFPFYMFGAFTYFSQIFITETTPNHWCWIPELANLSAIERRNLAIPKDVSSLFGYSRCESYVTDWSEVLATGRKQDQTWSTTPCQHGWEFNTTEIPYSTIASEMGWVCDKGSYQATAQSFFFVGSIIGGFIIGWVADRFGRLPAVVLSNMIACIAGSVTIFSNNFLQFTICRFFMGMSYDNCMMMVYLIVLEYIAPKYRTLVINLGLAIFFTIAATALPWIALASGHWKIFTLATSLPMVISLLAPFLMPESPRWLLSKGRVDDAVNKVLAIARINKKQVSSKLIEKFKASASNTKEESKSLIDLLRRPLLKRIFICMCLEFMCCMIIFDSLLRTIGQLQFNFFVSFSLVSLTEFPSLVILSFAMDYTGRKCMTITVLIVCGIFSFLIPIVGSGLPSVACAVIARFFINMACNTGMQWVAELMPTSVRGVGTSVAHICGYIGTVISPFVAYLDIYVYWLPMVVIGSLSILSALLALSLPETAKRDIPQTFEAAEDMFRNQGILDLPWTKKKNIDREVTSHVNQSFEMS